MPGDYSRFRFKPADHYSGVLLQQGRVQLDSDFNAFMEMLDRRWRSETIDVMGRGVVPRETPDAFKIMPGDADTHWLIGRGRIYVDGLQAENRGAEPVEYDPVLCEERGSKPLPLNDQPFHSPELRIPTEGNHLCYLRVRQREVTHLEDPAIRESAVGIDTVTQLQTVWQVGVLSEGKRLPIGTDLLSPKVWDGITRSSDGRLTTQVEGTAEPDDSCELSGAGGYRGLENRLYRLEVHTGGENDVTLKWSRDNASVGAAVIGISEARDELTVSQTKWDQILRFSKDDWIEITNDDLEFSDQSGEMCKILDVDDAKRTIKLVKALSAKKFPSTERETLEAVHTRIRRWDHKGEVFNKDGVKIGAVSEEDGLIHVYGKSGRPLEPFIAILDFEMRLENGISIKLSCAPNGKLKRGDYWVFAARTGTANIEPLTDAPPRGIHEHFCKLALIKDGVPNDLREKWPPEYEGHGCDCLVCVDAEGHNHNEEHPEKYTLQRAIETAGRNGGKVCVAPGLYHLTEPLKAAGLKSVQVIGCGPPTILVFEGRGAALEIDNCNGFSLDNVTVIALGDSKLRFEQLQDIHTSYGSKGVAAAVAAVQSSVSAGVVTASGCISLRIAGCQLVQCAGKEMRVPVVSLGGGMIGLTLANNTIVGGTGVANRLDEKNPYLVLCESTISGNVFECLSSALRFDSNVLCLLEHTMEQNLVVSTGAAAMETLAIMVGDDGLLSRLDISSNMIISAGDGIRFACDNVRVTANEIRYFDLTKQSASGNGIVVAGATKAFDKELAIERCQIVANRIAGFSTFGIAIATAVSDLMIRQNTIEGCLQGGICMTETGSAVHLKIRDNVLSDIGGAIRQPIIDAIRLVNAAHTDVTGNIVQRVGDAESQHCFGVRAAACDNLRIEGNTFEDVGPAKNEKCQTSVIEIEEPYNLIVVEKNRIEGNAGLSAEGHWQAIRAAGRTETKKPLEIVDLERPKYLLFASEVKSVKALAANRKAAEKMAVEKKVLQQTILIHVDQIAIQAKPEARAEVHGNEISGAGRYPLVRLNCGATRLSGNFIHTRNGSGCMDIDAAREASLTGNTLSEPLTISGAAIVTVQAKEQIEIRGNRIAGGGPHSACVATSGGFCLFSENRCDTGLAATAGKGASSEAMMIATSKPLIVITAESAIFSSNHVKGQDRATAVQLTLTGKANEKPQLYTVLGNVIRGAGSRILVGNLDLDDPWRSLNIVGV